MKKVVALLFLIISFTLQAQQTPDPRNMGGVGVVVVDYGYRSMNARTFVIPFLRVDTDRFFIQGPRLGMHLFRTAMSHLDLVMTPGFDGFDSNDSPYFAGMEDRDFAVFTGFQWTHRFNRTLTFSSAITTDITESTNGLRGSVTLSRNWFPEAWMITGSISLDWLSADIVDYYYGVRPQEVRPDRPAYAGTDTVNTNFSMMVTRSFGRSGVLIGMVGYGRYGSGITGSPLLERNHTLFSMAGIGWKF